MTAREPLIYINELYFQLVTLSTLLSYLFSYHFSIFLGIVFLTITMNWEQQLVKCYHLSRSLLNPLGLVGLKVYVCLQVT